MKIRKFIGFTLAAAMLATVASGCKHTDDSRTPPAGVWISFAFEDTWRTYGVTAALQHREFILSQGLPESFPYTAMSQTGYGGVLLVGDLQAKPAANDMSAPVANDPDIRLHYNAKHNDAVCERCGSHYHVIENYGQPKSGKAAELGYELRTYRIVDGPHGEYRVIRP